MLTLILTTFCNGVFVCRYKNILVDCNRLTFSSEVFEKHSAHPYTLQSLTAVEACLDIVEANIALRCGKNYMKGVDR